MGFLDGRVEGSPIKYKADVRASKPGPMKTSLFFHLHLSVQHSRGTNMFKPELELVLELACRCCTENNLLQICLPSFHRTHVMWRASQTSLRDCIKNLFVQILFPGRHRPGNRCTGFREFSSIHSKDVCFFVMHLQ